MQMRKAKVRVFTEWANQYLPAAQKASASSFADDWKTGNRLTSLLQALSSSQLQFIDSSHGRQQFRMDAKGRSGSQVSLQQEHNVNRRASLDMNNQKKAQEKISAILAFLHANGNIQLESGSSLVRAADIAEGRVDPILRLLWAMIKRYQVEVSAHVKRAILAQPAHPNQIVTRTVDSPATLEQQAHTRRGSSGVSSRKPRINRANSMVANNSLISWLRAQVAPFTDAMQLPEVRNFTSCFSDGKLLAALILSFSLQKEPVSDEDEDGAGFGDDLLINRGATANSNSHLSVATMLNMQPAERVEMVFRLAELHLGIPRLLAVADIVATPVRECTMVYLSFFRNYELAKHASSDVNEAAMAAVHASLAAASEHHSHGYFPSTPSISPADIGSSPEEVVASDSEGLCRYTELAPHPRVVKQRLVIGMSFDRNMPTRQSRGLYVYRVNQGSPAEASGILAKDTLVSVKSYQIDGVSDYFDALRDVRPGDSVPFVVYRGDRKHTLHVVVGGEAVAAVPSGASSTKHGGDAEVGVITRTVNGESYDHDQGKSSIDAATLAMTNSNEHSGLATTPARSALAIKPVPTVGSTCNGKVSSTAVPSARNGDSSSKKDGPDLCIPAAEARRSQWKSRNRIRMNSSNGDNVRGKVKQWESMATESVSKDSVTSADDTRRKFASKRDLAGDGIDKNEQSGSTAPLSTVSSPSANVSTRSKSGGRHIMTVREYENMLAKKESELSDLRGLLNALDGSVAPKSISEDGQARNKGAKDGMFRPCTRVCSRGPESCVVC